MELRDTRFKIHVWYKYLITIFLFYLFALLQNSFFIHFNLFGATLNLVFILFTILVFFEKKENYPQIIFTAVISGFFIDFFSYTYLGPGVIIFLVISFLFKKIQSLLKNRKENYPYVYFLPLFIVFFIIYSLFTGLYLYFLDPNRIIISFGIQTIFSLIYNSIVASIFFYICKKLFIKKQ